MLKLLDTADRTLDDAEQDAAMVHDAELAWLECHLDELYQHRGHWLAISVNGIVASADTMREAVQLARIRGTEQPLLFEVPDNDEGILVL